MEIPIIFQRAEGLAILISSVYFYFKQKGSAWMFILLLFLPDICMVGYVFGNKIGAIAYNIGHSLILPVIMLTLGIVWQNNLIVLLALVWLAHIGMDRALGYGLKTTKGFKHTHLGDIGKK